jgi:hypothetical protein
MPEPVMAIRDELRRQGLCKTFVHQFKLIAQRVIPKLKPRKRSRAEDIGNLFKRAVLKITRRNPRRSERNDTPPDDWDSLSWFRAWEYNPEQPIGMTFDEPIRSVSHIHESIFLASISTSFML